MKKITLEFQHQKLVFKIGEKEYFIDSDDVLNLLDGQKTREIFHSLDPAVIYADWENFDFIVRIEAMKEKGLNVPEIAAHIGTSEKRLGAWMLG